ncbi:MAG: CAP domain-containing protein [Cytophagaceae bacterium]|nr:MAG: CAP domain-containing protein [Cytophagaceae bacterium]
MAACQSDNVLDPAQEQTPVATSSTSIASEGATATSSGVVTGLIEVKPSSARAASAAMQQEILTYLNAARSKSCLCGSTTYAPAPALALNTKLNTASDKFALDMATYNYFSHTGRDGSQPWDRMTREGYIWRTAGENIAAGYTTARTVVDGWLKSPGHCANIMNPSFKEVGVGYGYSATSTYKHYWVNDFGTQR